MAGVETREFMRFTVEEVNAGHAVGWTLAAGWFPFETSWWAWFRREAPDG